MEADIYTYFLMTYAVEEVNLIANSMAEDILEALALPVPAISKAVP